MQLLHSLHSKRLTIFNSWRSGLVEAPRGVGESFLVERFGSKYWRWWQGEEARKGIEGLEKEPKRQKQSFPSCERWARSDIGESWRFCQLDSRDVGGGLVQRASPAKEEAQERFWERIPRTKLLRLARLK